MSFNIEDYEPVHGDQITGSPALLSRYISKIFAAGAHFQYVDGETIEVIKPGVGEVIVPAPAAALPVEEVVEEVTVAEPVEVIEEVVTEAVEQAVDAADDAPAVEAPKPRGRKPKAAESTETVEE